MVTVLIGGVLHLDQLALGGEEAVAAGHQHGGAGGVAHLLPGTAIIIGETEKNIGFFPILVRCLNLVDSLEVVGAIFSGRIVQDTKSDSDVSALSSLSVLIHKVRLLEVLTPALSPASLAPLLPLVSSCSLLAKSSSARSVAAMGASITLASVKGRGLESLVKLGKVQRELPGLSVTRGELGEVIIIREEIPGQDGGGEGHDSQEETHDATEVQGWV